MGSPDDIVPESEELYIVLHVNDIDVPLSQPESGGQPTRKETP